MDREPAKSFQDLIVWQKSHSVTLHTYKTTASFPKYELYGLAAQMPRAAVSVAANIAEGFSKRSRSDKARFMNIAQASLEELRYYFILARDLGYLNASSEPAIDETARLLGAYVRTLHFPRPSS
jgi:four helix bundle protein